MYTVCLVEDEIDLSNLIKTYLEKAGYQVVCFTKGNDAIQYIGNKVHLWILDIMLGDDVNGYDVIKAIREQDENIPVIFTSARDQDLDKILGLELGSDDYITKPFNPVEVIARVKAVISRSPHKSGAIKVAGITIDKNAKTVSVADEVVNLTKTEYQLLLTMAQEPGRIFSREELMDRVWGDGCFVEARTVDVHITRLRKKLGHAGEAIVNRSGYGYCIKEKE